jgi:polyhydroxybutyrate depolymerase
MHRGGSLVTFMTCQLATRRSSAAAVLTGLVLCGCGSSPTSAVPTSSPPAATSIAGSIEHGTITVGRVTHSYRLFTPEKLDAQNPTAMVLLLHRCGSSGDEFASVTHFDEQAAAGGIVAVYPDGLANFGAPGFNHCWNEYLDPTLTDDFTFLSQLIDRLTKNLPIDKNRIFVAGLQSGGHMAYTLACVIPERIAAIASISGGMPLDERKASMRCSDNKRAKPVSVMEMHGTADSFAPYEGGGDLNVPPTLDVVKYWATVNGCSGDPSVNQSGITKTTLWNRCSGTSVVRLDTVTGGHNTWFGSTLDPVPGEPKASAVVWDFFNSVH